MNPHDTTILVADDSPTLLRVVSGVLDQRGYRVVTAEDGVDAVRRFYAERPDLVICDVAMPHLSGYLVCRLLKEDWSAAHVPVMLLTSHAGAADRFWGRKTGAERYMTKDFGPDDLLNAVSDLLEARRSAPPEPPVPEELGEADVLVRVTEMLDRKLCEQLVAGEMVELGAEPLDLAATADAALGVIAEFCEHTVGGIVLVDTRTLYARPVGVASRVQLDDFTAQLRGALNDTVGPTGGAYGPSDLNVVTLESAGAVADGPPGGLATFVSMPLRRGGHLVGILGLGAAVPNAFGEPELRLLRIVEHPLAAVVLNAERGPHSATHVQMRGYVGH